MSKYELRPFKQEITNVNMGGYMSKDRVKYLVFHFVGAAGQAYGNASFFKNKMRYASAHLFIDPNYTVQVVPFNRVSWAVGDGQGRYGISNDNSISVELCQDTSTGRNAWEWDFHPDTRMQAILVFAHLMKEYNVPLSHVVRHYDASRKSCPGNWMANDWKKWKLWKADLELYVKTGKLVDSQRGIVYIDKNIKEQPKTPNTTPKLTNREIAKQVYRGDWGNGQERKDKLTKAGYNYSAVQAEVAKYKDELNTGKKKPVEIPKSVGVYKFNTKVWVRNEAYEGKDTVSKDGYMYDKDDTVSLEKVFDRDGWVWGQYTSYSGKQRFVKIGAVGGKQFATKL
ncbi:N-acetylmuramoyl-L-alanine amidase [Facklamia sp. 7083-14-GEN3]|uniref:N-acetylmuramoyl-L-alanine amidase n=1 Tax=Facklamia sp. 7083-14-GEN3 TaxID=2973478 RepID=UPI00215C6837|nr:N-acetylmuramoyl-L-alanine amidase [Facklamia sp. 7083-14-GEN3]MCR8969260.1 N-acetylmuramoyl-L-alanine amidase [Facklamia sp. 7083-14-GEN3]